MTDTSSVYLRPSVGWWIVSLPVPATKYGRRVFHSGMEPSPRIVQRVDGSRDLNDAAVAIANNKTPTNRYAAPIIKKKKRFVTTCPYERNFAFETSAERRGYVDILTDDRRKFSVGNIYGASKSDGQKKAATKSISDGGWPEHVFNNRINEIFEIDFRDFGTAGSGIREVRLTYRIIELRKTVNFVFKSLTHTTSFTNFRVFAYTNHFFN